MGERITAMAIATPGLSWLTVSGNRVLGGRIITHAFMLIGTWLVLTWPKRKADLNPAPAGSRTSPSHHHPCRHGPLRGARASAGGIVTTSLPDQSRGRTAPGFPLSVD